MKSVSEKIIFFVSILTVTFFPTTALASLFESGSWSGDSFFARPMPTSPSTGIGGAQSAPTPSLYPFLSIPSPSSHVGEGIFQTDRDSQNSSFLAIKRVNKSIKNLARFSLKF